MLKRFLLLSKGLLLLSILSVYACESNQEDAAGKRVEGISQDATDDISAIIRNPVTADDAQLDTTNVAKLVFTEPVFEFGEVDASAVINHTFVFTNVGKVPLIISDVRSTCGCTVAEWPKNPIPAGKTGEISVKFDTKNKDGMQGKPITITANTYPAKTVIYLNGKVFGTANQ